MPPTFEADPVFRDQWDKLTQEQQRRFMSKVLSALVPALDNHAALPAGLRVKRVQGTDHIFEMSWAPDGRATFEYGTEVREGIPHIVWRRIGTHAIFANP